MYTHYGFNDSFAVAGIFCSISKVLSLLLFDNLRSYDPFQVFAGQSRPRMYWQNIPW